MSLYSSALRDVLVLSLSLSLCVCGCCIVASANVWGRSLSIERMAQWRLGRLVVAVVGRAIGSASASTAAVGRRYLLLQSRSGSSTTITTVTTRTTSIAAILSCRRYGCESGYGSLRLASSTSTHVIRSPMTNATTRGTSSTTSNNANDNNNNSSITSIDTPVASTTPNTTSSVEEDRKSVV